ncbi:unnamed protein product [Amoebophrya sp. A120]|nr:unnamed protein product [Amoebophrya sp. A120]|eukprot:GSA120T00022549001.1
MTTDRRDDDAERYAMYDYEDKEAITVKVPRLCPASSSAGSGENPAVDDRVFDVYWKATKYQPRGKIALSANRVRENAISMGALLKKFEVAITQFDNAVWVFKNCNSSANHGAPEDVEKTLEWFGDWALDLKQFVGYILEEDGKNSHQSLSEADYNQARELKLMFEEAARDKEWLALKARRKAGVVVDDDGAVEKASGGEASAGAGAGQPGSSSDDGVLEVPAATRHGTGGCEIRGASTSSQCRSGPKGEQQDTKAVGEGSTEVKGRCGFPVRKFSLENEPSLREKDPGRREKEGRCSHPRKKTASNTRHHQRGHGRWNKSRDYTRDPRGRDDRYAADRRRRSSGRGDRNRDFHHGGSSRRRSAGRGRSRSREDRDKDRDRNRDRDRDKDRDWNKGRGREKGRRHWGSKDRDWRSRDRYPDQGRRDERDRDWRDDRGWGRDAGDARNRDRDRRGCDDDKTGGAKPRDHQSRCGKPSPRDKRKRSREERQPSSKAAVAAGVRDRDRGQETERCWKLTLTSLCILPPGKAERAVYVRLPKDYFAASTSSSDARDLRIREHECIWRELSSRTTDAERAIKEYFCVCDKYVVVVFNTPADALRVLEAPVTRVVLSDNISVADVAPYSRDRARGNKLPSEPKPALPRPAAVSSSPSTTSTAVVVQGAVPKSAARVVATAKGDLPAANKPQDAASSVVIPVATGCTAPSCTGPPASLTGAASRPRPVDHGRAPVLNESEGGGRVTRQKQKLKRPRSPEGAVPLCDEQPHQGQEETARTCHETTRLDAHATAARAGEQPTKRAERTLATFIFGDKRPVEEAQRVDQLKKTSPTRTVPNKKPSCERINYDELGLGQACSSTERTADTLNAPAPACEKVTPLVPTAACAASVGIKVAGQRAALQEEVEVPQKSQRGNNNKAKAMKTAAGPPLLAGGGAKRPALAEKQSAVVQHPAPKRRKAGNKGSAVAVQQNKKAAEGGEVPTTAASASAVSLQMPTDSGIARNKANLSSATSSSTSAQVLGKIQAPGTSTLAKPPPPPAIPTGPDVQQKVDEWLGFSLARIQTVCRGLGVSLVEGELRVSLIAKALRKWEAADQKCRAGVLYCLHHHAAQLASRISGQWGEVKLREDHAEKLVQAKQLKAQYENAWKVINDFRSYSSSSAKAKPGQNQK